MDIVVAGGTGFIGRRLCDTLLRHGHAVTILTRNHKQAEQLFGTAIRAVEWDAAKPGSWEESLKGVHAVVNLTGAPIADARWSDQRKKVIRNSRITTTRLLVQACSRLSLKPSVLINASGIGIYGPQDSRVLDETSSPGKGFLADLCLQWESEARGAAAHGIRVVSMRTGMVLEKQGGALPRMAFPFRLFAGGPVMPGTQWVSWIHRDDLVGLIEWVLTNPTVSGPVNAVAPSPVTMAEFCKTLGKVLHRPCWLPVPEFVMKAALGELGSLMTTGQRVMPVKALSSGYCFQYPTLEEALQAVFREPTAAGLAA